MVKPFKMTFGMRLRLNSYFQLKMTEMAVTNETKILIFGEFEFRVRHF